MGPQKTDAACILKEPFTHKIGQRTALRLYPDTQPHCLEIASLHKGLIVVFDGVERVEEGAGFGVPIIKYKKTYFPTKAQCHIEKTEQGTSIFKDFELNAIARKKIAKTVYFNDSFYHFFRKIFERIYLTKKSNNFLLNKLMEFRNYAGVETEFVEVKSKGKVTVKYGFMGAVVDVEIDFTDLEMPDCQEILILNEQGAGFFSKYADTSGLELCESKISGWNIVNADSAHLFDQHEQLRFTLHKTAAAQLFRGREKTNHRFSWSGLSYSLKPPQTKFHYTIKMQEKGREQKEMSEKLTPSS
jgi:hypothetical protein